MCLPTIYSKLSWKLNCQLDFDAYTYIDTVIATCFLVMIDKCEFAALGSGLVKSIIPPNFESGTQP